MTESEVDAIVGRLVPEFETTKFAAIHAREEFFALAAGDCANGRAAFEAQRRWLKLEATCELILRQIDDLAERSAA